MRKLVFAIFLISATCFYACKEKVVKYADSGKTIQLTVNQVLKVQLPGDAASSSDWRKTSYNDSVLIRKGKSNYMLGDGTSSEPGMYIFRFLAIAPGKSKLIMEYGHKRDLEKPASRTFELDIIISANPSKDQ